jgi:hypothetical protein
MSFFRAACLVLLVWSPVVAAEPKGATPDIPGPWSVFQSERDGKPLFARFNAGASKMAGNPAYATRVGVIVSLNRPNEHGLPAGDEFAQLNAIEDHVMAELGQQGAIFVGSITTAGTRELVFYTGAVDAVKKRFAVLQKATTSHRMQLTARADKTWSDYRRFVH